MAITVLISALAFAVFAIFDTLANFSAPNVLKNQLKTSLSKTVVTTAEYVVDRDEGDSYNVKLSENVIGDLESKTGGKVKGIFNLSDNTAGSVKQTFSISELSSSDVVVGKKYYASSIIGFVEFDVDEEIKNGGKFRDFDYKLVYGEYPRLVYEEGVLLQESMYRVAISTYLADSIIYYLNGRLLNEKYVAGYEDLLGATVTVDQQEYKIVGLIDCGQIPKKYDLLKQSTPYNEKTKTLTDDYEAYINSGAQKCFFTPNGFLETYKQERRSADVYHVGNVNLTLSIEYRGPVKQVEPYVFNAEDYTANNILLFDEKYGQNGEISLGDDEILIHHLQLRDVFASEIDDLASSEERAYVKNLITNMRLGTVDANRAALKEIFSRLRLDMQKLSLNTVMRQHFTETGVKTEKPVKIVGAYFDVDPENYTSADRYKLMMNKSLMRELSIFSEQGDYSKILFSEQSISTRDGVNLIADYLTSENGFTLNWYNNSVLMLIKENEVVIRQVADLFLYVALALACFSVFMLYNYMSTSIANKKQSVGVLRALGAGGKDILFTFLTESLLISVFNGLLANVFAMIGVDLVNAYIVRIMNISVHFALFGARQILIVSSVSLLTAIISSALPILKIIKKKPVKLIRQS